MDFRFSGLFLCIPNEHRCASIYTISLCLHVFLFSLHFIVLWKTVTRCFYSILFHPAANLHHGRSLIYHYLTFFLKQFIPDQPLSKQHTFIFLSFNIQQLPRALSLFEHNKYHVCLKNGAPFRSLELKVPRFPSKCNSSRLKGLFFCESKCSCFNVVWPPLSCFSDSWC